MKYHHALILIAVLVTLAAAAVILWVVQVQETASQNDRRAVATIVTAAAEGLADQISRIDEGALADVMPHMTNAVTDARHKNTQLELGIFVPPVHPNSSEICAHLQRRFERARTDHPQKQRLYLATQRCAQEDDTSFHAQEHHGEEHELHESRQLLQLATSSDAHVIQTLASQALSQNKTITNASDPGTGLIVVATPVLMAGGHYVAAWAMQRTSHLAPIPSLPVLALVLFFCAGCVGVGVAVRLHTQAANLRHEVQMLEHDLQHRLPTDSTELGEISASINTLATALHTKNLESRRLHTELARKERLVAMGRLLAGVSHEVRNPLGALKLRLQTLRRATQGAQTDAVTAALLDTERIEHLLTRLLGLARGPDKQVEGVKAQDILDGVLKMLEPLAREHHVTLRVVSCAPGSWRADRLALEQALANLVDNAIRASVPGDAVLLQVDRDVAQAPGKIIFRVIDVGPPTSDDVLKSALDPFFTTRADGTGLGLAIASEIAHAHGGHVALRSGKTRGVVAELVVCDDGGQHLRSKAAVGVLDEPT